MINGDNEGLMVQENVRIPYHGKQIFTLPGKHLFTRYGKQTLLSVQLFG